MQINWHDTKPVLTLDFHPVSGVLATGGADFDIKIWQIDSGQVEGKIPTASYQMSLSYHSSAVNVLRFSPSGQLLASGADGGELILWKSHATDASQTWKVQKTLSFHRKDVLDLQWSKDGAFLVTGSVDNSCIIWDADKGSVHQILDGHLHYVQGVAWDPLSKYVTSLSSDRTCRIYVNKPQRTKDTGRMNYVCQHVISKVEQQTADDAKCLKNHLFHDETLPSFFRRLAWSPDGSFLLVPAAGYFKLPYRLVFAVATLNSLYIYDTETVIPLAIFAGLHYAAITDVTWSPNGRYLALSSQDGYCTLVEFQSEELGSPLLLSDGKPAISHGTSSPIRQKLAEIAVEASENDNCVILQKKPVDSSEVKEAMPVATGSPPITNKPAKRRITPIAIDP